MKKKKSKRKGKWVWIYRSKRFPFYDVFLSDPKRFQCCKVARVDEDIWYRIGGLKLSPGEGPIKAEITHSVWEIEP